MSSKPFHSTVTIEGTISGTSGFVRFDEEVKSKDTFRSPELKIYNDGERVKMIFRVSGSGTRRLVRHSLVKKETHRIFDVFLESYDDTDPIIASRQLHVLTETTLGEVTQILNQVRSGEPFMIMHEVEENEVPEIMEKLEEYTALAFKAILTQSKEEEHEVEVFPSWIDGFHIDTDHAQIFSVVESIVEDGHCVNIMARGDSGYGKTTLFKMLAQQLGYDFIRINCATIQDTIQWFGYNKAKDGTTFFEKTRFTELITKGKAVVLLDEANRIEPWLANSLFSILDDDRKTEVENTEIVVGESVVFALSINEGVKFAGTHVMDTAFKNRIPLYIKVGPKQPDIESKIIQARWDAPENLSTEIVRHIGELRRIANTEGLEVDVSTRTSLNIAFLMRYGMSIKQAFISCILESADEFEKKAINDYIEAQIR